jgi:hypothetical protein
MYDDIAKLLTIMIGAKVKESSSWTLMLKINYTWHGRFGNSFDNDGDLLTKLRTMFKTFDNVYGRSFNMMGKPRTFDFLVATTINHKRWVLLQKVHFSPLDPCCRFMTLRARLKTREFLLKKKPLEPRSQFLTIGTWSKNFFLEKRD